MKLLDRIKSWFGIKPKEELIEETRIITDKNSGIEPPKGILMGVYHTKMILSYLIEDAIKNNRIKGYKNLLKFINKYPCNYIPRANLNNIRFTLDDESIKLCKTMLLLGYKTKDKYLSAMIRWGKFFSENHGDNNHVKSIN